MPQQTIPNPPTYRFHLEQLSSVKKDVIFVAYINHVEKLEPRFSSEVYCLAGNAGAVCINGQRGVVMATDRLDVLGLDADFDGANNCHDGVQVTVLSQAWPIRTINVFDFEVVAAREIYACVQLVVYIASVNKACVNVINNYGSLQTLINSSKNIC